MFRVFTRAGVTEEGVACFNKSPALPDTYLNMHLSNHFWVGAVLDGGMTVQWQKSNEFSINIYPYSSLLVGLYRRIKKQKTTMNLNEIRFVERGIFPVAEFTMT